MADGRSLRLRSHATGQTPATMSELPAIAPHSSSAIYAVGEFLIAIFFGVLEVVFFWQNRLWSWIRQPSEKRQLLDGISQAESYEEWEQMALLLDQKLGFDVWRRNSVSKAYNFKVIEARLLQFIDVLRNQDINALVRLLRSGLVRNLGNITSPALYNRAYAGTKLMISDYVSHIAIAIDDLTHWPTDQGEETGLSSQDKLNVLHDTRLAFGRTCLVLQGGSMFGICHLGVVKALHLRGLLPRIIAGTATGALMAALVAVHTDSELLDFLRGDMIDLSAFVAAREKAEHDAGHPNAPDWLQTLIRRWKRARRTGYVLDLNILGECVHANVGDLTFEEAYQRTKRILNITISTSDNGIPTLLNYLTAPNVLIWSAALLSNTTDASNSPVQLQCKNADGSITPWDLSSQSPQPLLRIKSHIAPSTEHDHETPLSRVSELFNVNHFIVSQARPYIAPFLAPTLHHSNSPRSSHVPLTTYFMRLAAMEVQHRLTQLNSLGMLHPIIRRLLLDEMVPGPSWTLVPRVSLTDFKQLLGNPTADKIDYWILRGERSVWPAVDALSMRCTVEFALDRAYQLVRSRKPFDLATEAEEMPDVVREKRKKRKMRSSSTVTR